MSLLDLDTALTLAQRAIAEGVALGYQPLAAAVLDRHGHPLAVLRHPDASFLRPQIATAKARGCVGMGFGGRELARRAQAVPSFFDAVNSLTGGQVVPVAGGVLIRDSGGGLLGALGISGDTSDNDERCALAAIEAANLVADTGA
ncbi:GlcG/HbpS family heme-binding protein [Pseudomonas sp. DC3000-4b1]|uniref:GlcG/HbpS family heme-binding protein n=1 Tax=unclassified Pseudomonas TaxID=196821 RepID=UPI003CE68F78